MKAFCALEKPIELLQELFDKLDDTHKYCHH